MKTIIILDYCNSEVDIIHQVPPQEDYDNYISTVLNYDLDNIHYMVVENKIIIPNHFTPKDFN